MKVSIKVVPQLKCSRLYDPFSIKITSNHLCAGGQLGFDSCKGRAKYYIELYSIILKFFFTHW